MKFNYKETVRYLLVALALFFSPILIPLFVTILVVSLTVSGGILALCLMFGAMFVSFLIGIFAVPVLLSTVITISFYVFFKIVQSSWKKFGRFKLFVWLGNKLPKNVGCIPILKTLRQFGAYSGGKIRNCNQYQKNKELTKMDSWGNIPSFEAEVEEESKHLTIPPNLHFPFPRASLRGPMTEDYNGVVENLMQKIEELHEIVCLLQTPLSSRTEHVAKQ